MNEEKGALIDAATKSVTGRIIGTGNGRIIASVQNDSNDDIPFVPAFDLLEKELNVTISESEVAAIASALWIATGEAGPAVPSAWSINARVAAISQRG